MTPVVGSNLARTGLFRIANTTGITKLPTHPRKSTRLTSRGMEALEIGSIEPMPDGRFNVSFRLFDVSKQMQTAGHELPVGELPNQRATAHKISGMKFTRSSLGERSVFLTRIAYVPEAWQLFELQVADADGFNPQAVLTSVEPIRFAEMVADGTKLAYVSFEKRKSTVFVQDLVTGQREPGKFQGRQLRTQLVARRQTLGGGLSKDSISQIYTIPAAGGEATRVTKQQHRYQCHVHARWREHHLCPDRSGGPTLHRAANGGDVKRLTFEGSYNVNPRMSPDGKLVAFIARGRALARRHAGAGDGPGGPVLTDGPLDDSPVFTQWPHHTLRIEGRRGAARWGGVSRRARETEIEFRCGDARNLRGAYGTAGGALRRWRRMTRIKPGRGIGIHFGCGNDGILNRRIAKEREDEEDVCTCWNGAGAVHVHPRSNPHRSRIQSKRRCSSRPRPRSLRRRPQPRRSKRPPPG